MPSESQPEWATATQSAPTQPVSAPSLSDWLNKTPSAAPEAPSENVIGLEALPSIDSLHNPLTVDAFPSTPAPAEPALPMFPGVEPIPTPFASLPTIEALTGEPLPGPEAMLPPTAGFGAAAALPNFGSVQMPSFGDSPTAASSDASMPSFPTSPAAMPSFAPLADLGAAPDPAPLAGSGFSFGQVAPSLDPVAPSLESLQPTSFDAAPMGFGAAAPMGFGAAAPAFESLQPTSFDPTTMGFGATTPAFESLQPTSFDPPTMGFGATAPTFETLQPTSFDPLTMGFGAAAPMGFGATAPAFETLQPTSFDPTTMGFGAAAPAFDSFPSSTDAAPLAPASFDSFPTASAFPLLSAPEAQQGSIMDDPADNSTAVWNPYPAAQQGDPSGWEPTDSAALPTSEQFGSHFRLRDEGGFSTPFNTDPEALPESTPGSAKVTEKDKGRKGLAAKFGRGAKDAEPLPASAEVLGSTPPEGKAKKQPKVKAEKPAKGKTGQAGTGELANAEAALAALAGSDKGSSKLGGLFKKSEPKTPSPDQILRGAAAVSDDEDESGDTARLVRILASLCLAAGLLLGAYTIFSAGDTPTVVPQEPTATVPVPDVGLAPAVPTEAPTLAPTGEVTQDPAATGADDSLDFSDGADFSAGQDFSVPGT